MLTLASRSSSASDSDSLLEMEAGGGVFADGKVQFMRLQSTGLLKFAVADRDVWSFQANPSGSESEPKAGLSADEAVDTDLLRFVELVDGAETKGDSERAGEAGSGEDSSDSESEL